MGLSKLRKDSEGFDTHPHAQSDRCITWRSVYVKLFQYVFSLSVSINVIVVSSPLVRMFASRIISILLMIATVVKLRQKNQFCNDKTCSTEWFDALFLEYFRGILSVVPIANRSGISSKLGDNSDAYLVTGKLYMLTWNLHLNAIKFFTRIRTGFFYSSRSFPLTLSHVMKHLANVKVITLPSILFYLFVSLSFYILLGA